MSFDWGGFAGGIVGVIGAYGVAVWQIRNQRKAEKPAKDRRAYVLCSRIKDHLNTAWTYFTTENYNYGELFKSVIQMNRQLREYLPEAIETDPRLVSLITETIEGLNAISKKYSAKPRNHDNYMDYETELLTFVEVIRSKCDELIDEIQKRNKQDF